MRERKGDLMKSEQYSFATSDIVNQTVLVCEISNFVPVSILCIFFRYESILSCIESMREDLTSLDDAMNSLIKEKDVANEEMRKVERSLVEVLVGQQKKLLSIISRDEGTDDISIDL